MTRRARLTCVADVEPEDIKWRWRNRLAQGKITLLAGDPGAGKTYLALAITAAQTRGWALPGETTAHEPAHVVYLSREDDVGDTLRPRLDNLGADVSRVHVLAGATDGAPVSLADVDVIADALQTTAAALVVIDPIQSWLGSRIDAHRANETRPVLDALGAVCARYRCAVLVIAHIPKARQGRPVTAALGSIDFAAAARVMLVAGANPKDASCSVLAGVKNNIGPLPPSLGYLVDPATGGFSWLGAMDVTAADVLGANAATEGDRSALTEAVDWLRQELAAGGRTADEIRQEARRAGISISTLRRAKRAAGVRAMREGWGPGGKWFWSIGDIGTQTNSKSTYNTYGEGEIEIGII